jgi:flagellar biogenesis protein FliO
MTDVIQPNLVQTGVTPSARNASPVSNRNIWNVWAVATMVAGLLATLAWVALLAWGLSRLL